MDGLENVCRVAVCGGLDWSPGVHEQCIGRVHRDGQQDPVMAYFLVSEEGSDPVVSGVLGIQREQIESVRHPDAGLIERLEISEHPLQKLEHDSLPRTGLALLPDIRRASRRARQPERTCGDRAMKTK